MVTGNNGHYIERIHPLVNQRPRLPPRTMRKKNPTRLDIMPCGVRSAEDRVQQLGPAPPRAHAAHRFARPSRGIGGHAGPPGCFYGFELGWMDHGKFSSTRIVQTNDSSATDSAGFSIERLSAGANVHDFPCRVAGQMRHRTNRSAEAGCLRVAIVGPWLSLVERLVRDEEVASSNLAGPTIFHPAMSRERIVRCCCRGTYGCRTRSCRIRSSDRRVRSRPRRWVACTGGNRSTGNLWR